MDNSNETKVEKLEVLKPLTPLVPEDRIDTGAFKSWLFPVLRNVNAATLSR